MVSVPVALPLKLIDTLKPLAIVAEKLKHCHVVEVCEPTADNPSRTTIPIPREWFERTADDLEAIAILMHGAGVLSEGQASTLTGLDRVEIRKQVDALTAAPVREEGGVVKSMGQRAYERMRDHNDNASPAMNSTKPWTDLSEDVRRRWDEDATERPHLYGLRCPALATREEAPAEAGEHPCYGEHQPGCDCVIPAQVASPAPSHLSRLSAQPQSREEAQPVGLDEAQRKATERAAMDAGTYSWRNCRLAMVEGDKIVGYPAFSRADMAELARLYTTPPAPEAEKMRVAVSEVELIESITRAVEQDFVALEAAWPQSKRGSRAQKAYDKIKGRWEGVRDCARDALAALQQEGRS